MPGDRLEPRISERVAVQRRVGMLGEEALAVGGDLHPDPGGELGILAAHALGQPMADLGALDDERRAARLAQAVEQVGVLVPEHERRVEELAGRVGELLDGFAPHREAPGREVEAHRAVDGQRASHRDAGVDRRAQRRPPAGQRLDVVVHHDHIRGPGRAQAGVDRCGEALRRSAVVDDHDLVGGLGGALHRGDAGTHALGRGVERRDDDGQLGCLAGGAAGAAGPGAGCGDNAGRGR